VRNSRAIFGTEEHMRWLPMLLLMTLPAAAWAQRAGDRQLTGQVGWQWGGTQTYSTYSAYPAGDVHAEAAVNYGGTFTVFVREGEALEIAYSYQPTDLILRPNGIPSFKIADLACHTLHLNGLRALPAGGGKVEPFVLGGLGTTVFSAQGYTSRWLFSIAAGLGFMVPVNERLGLRAQGRMIVPMSFNSGAFYFGGGGASISVSGQAFLQGDASIGLSLKL
jgi:hypothetical protein